MRPPDLWCGWNLVRFLDRNLFHCFGLFLAGFGNLDFLPYRRQLGGSGLQLFQLGEDHASLLSH